MYLEKGVNNITALSAVFIPATVGPDIKNGM